MGMSAELDQGLGPMYTRGRTNRPLENARREAGKLKGGLDIPSMTTAAIGYFSLASIHDRFEPATSCAGANQVLKAHIDTCLLD